MFKEDISLIKSLLDKLQKDHHDLEEKHESNLEKVKAYEECMTSLKACQEENHQLKKKIELLEQNYQEFSRVSHVVALEKEIARLRDEVAKLKEKPPPPKPEQPTPVHVPETSETPAPESDEPEEEFYEKKIKGVVYYVSNLTHKIFQKTEDNDVGSELGILQKEIKNNKTVTKVTWL